MVGDFSGNETDLISLCFLIYALRCHKEAPLLTSHLVSESVRCKLKKNCLFPVCRMNMKSNIC